MSMRADVFRHALLPAYEGLRGRGMLRYLEEYERTQWLSGEQLDRLRWNKLQDLLAHCWSHVPYYREHWGRAGLGEIGEIRSMRDFEALPLLTKQHVRDNWDGLVSASHRGRLLVKATSGSTGAPMRLGYDRESYDRRVAVMHRGYAWTGASMGERTAYLWGGHLVPPHWRQRLKDRLYNAAFNRLLLNTDVLDDRTLARYAAELNRFCPQTIVAFVMPMDHLAQYVIARGLSMHRPQRILSAAERLHTHQRERIERAFGAPVYDTYGCREVMLVAAECTVRSGLHVNADHLIAECIATDATADGAGEVVLTDLHNYGMPLVRYLNGDIARPAHTACGCGRGLPLWERIDGRILDALRAPDGRLVAGERIVNIFMGVPGVHQFQAYQPSTGALEMRIVRGRGFQDEALNPAREQLRKAFGEEMAISFGFYDEIPAGPGGKRRVTLREVA